MDERDYKAMNDKLKNKVMKKYNEYTTSVISVTSNSGEVYLTYLLNDDMFPWEGSLSLDLSKRDKQKDGIYWDNSSYIDTLYTSIKSKDKHTDPMKCFKKDCELLGIDFKTSKRDFVHCYKKMKKLVKFYNKLKHNGRIKS